MDPKYSIIVPAHNSAGFIQKCLNSIEDQVFDRSMYELIVVCDRCTDDTYKVAMQHADKVVTADWGSDGSRQEGIDVASGEWILFLDDDDWFLHEYALALIDAELSDKIDVLCYGFIFKGVGYAAPIRIVNGTESLWPAVWCKCYRREFIKDIRFNNIIPTPDGNAADIDWTRRVFEKIPIFRTLNQPLYYYNYLRPGSQTVEKVKINDSKTVSLTGSRP